MSSTKHDIPPVVKYYQRFTKMIYTMVGVGIISSIILFVEAFFYLRDFKLPESQAVGIYSNPIGDPTILEKFLASWLGELGYLGVELILVSVFLIAVFLLVISTLFLHNLLFNFFLKEMGIDKIAKNKNLDVSWDYVKRKIVIRRGILPIAIVRPENTFWKLLEI